MQNKTEYFTKKRIKYFNSERYERALEKGRITRRKNYEKRIEEYNQNLKFCLNCKVKIEFIKRRNKFCSNRCSAIVTNRTRKPPSKEQKRKTSASLKGYISSKKGKHFIKINDKLKEVGKYKTITYNNCKICGNLFTWTTKNTKSTCSEKCRIIAIFKGRKYQNGKRKLIEFFNPFENKNIYLESSWELKIAELLISKNIKWIRPEPIKWIDSKDKEHFYFPDFYLESYDLYLDPKNPYCMEQDKEKMEQINEIISIEYGDINNIVNFVNNLN